MTLANWDPLEKNLSEELASATIKREIKNILKSYTGWFDPLSELIQNALDAIEHRRQKREVFDPSIWIQIDLRNLTMSVTDNGIGFSEDQFRNFLAPNVSFKKHGDRGNKGVGATYIGYGFNYLQIGTKTADFSCAGVLKDGREWVEDDTGTKTRPKIQDCDVLHDAFRQIDRGSTFTLKLTGDFIRPRDLKWVGATNADQWEAVLRIKTPLGGIYLGREPMQFTCFLSIIDESGTTTQKTSKNCDYIYPHTVVKTCLELNAIRKIQQDRLSKGQDASKLPDSCYKLNGLFNYWDVNQLISDQGDFGGVLDGNEKHLASTHKMSVYGFFCYSTEIWDKYNDEVVGLRKGSRILRGGIQLSANGMPQGELLMIPLTKNIGYQNVTHVVVHFDSAEPDLGRKGFQPELGNLAQKIGTAVVRRFLNWRGHLKKDTGAPIDIQGQKDIHDWIREQEEREKTRPLVIKRQDVFLPMKEPAITSEPWSEQDVVALFNQLLAGGVIRGIKVLSTSQHQQYDGIFRYLLKAPLENHRFNLESNPLGLEESQLKEYLSAPEVLEYKYSMEALLEEIEKGEKMERHIHLVVAWEMGASWSKRYTITSLLDLDNLQHRFFHGGTHLIKDESTGDRVFAAIILSELVAYVNDPAAVQQYHKKTYADT